MRFYVVGTVEGGASSESERKKPGDSSPTQPLPEGHRDSQAAGAKGTVALASGSRPLTPTAFSLHSLPGSLALSLLLLCLLFVAHSAALYSLSPVIFHFHPHFSILYPGLSFSCFLSMFSMQMESCSRDPPSPPALKEKTDPRRQTLPLGCWKQAS